MKRRRPPASDDTNFRIRVALAGAASNGVVVRLHTGEPFTALLSRIAAKLGLKSAGPAGAAGAGRLTLSDGALVQDAEELEPEDLTTFEPAAGAAVAEEKIHNGAHDDDGQLSESECDSGSGGDGGSDSSEDEEPWEEERAPEPRRRTSSGSSQPKQPKQPKP
eukprot:COSAG05_NODE_9748_length_604_cov_0.691089_1_plen_162_part_10